MTFEEVKALYYASTFYINAPNYNYTEEEHAQIDQHAKEAEAEFEAALDKLEGEELLKFKKWFTP